MILVQNGIMEISLLSVFCVELDRLGLLNQAMILLAVYLLKVCSLIDRSRIKVDYIVANPGFPRLEAPPKGQRPQPIIWLDWGGRIHTDPLYPPKVPKFPAQIQKKFSLPKNFTYNLGK